MRAVMSRALVIEACGPAVTLQDLGRPGYLAAGLSPGGAMDVVALHEAAALLGAPVTQVAALEMAGMGGRFRVTEPARIALTGAPMRASLSGVRLRWNAVHAVRPDAILEIGPCLAGQYGYLSVGGGFDTPLTMGSRATHLRGGLGAGLGAGTALPLGPDPTPTRVGLCLPEADRFGGGVVRVLPSAQTELFPGTALQALEQTIFRRSPRGSRLGTALDGAPEALRAPGGLSLLSEIVQTGDIQITGDGTPFLLLADCQTTGGYPRIACILPQDIPRAAQAAAGAALQFRMSARADALAGFRRWQADLAELPARCGPMIRSPGDMTDLLGAQLISGVTAGRDPS